MEEGEEGLTLQYLKPSLTSSSVGNLKDIFAKSRCIYTYVFAHMFKHSQTCYRTYSNRTELG